MAFSFNGSDQGFEAEFSSPLRPFCFGTLFKWTSGNKIFGMWNPGAGTTLHIHRTSPGGLLLISSGSGGGGNSSGTTQHFTAGTWCAALVEAKAGTAPRIWLYDRPADVWEAEDRAADDGEYAAAHTMCWAHRNEGSPDLFTEISLMHSFVINGEISDDERIRFGAGESPRRLWARGRFIIYRSLYGLNHPDDIGPPLQSVDPASFPTIGLDAERVIRPPASRRARSSLSASVGAAGAQGLPSLGQAADAGQAFEAAAAQALSPATQAAVAGMDPDADADQTLPGATQAAVAGEAFEAAAAQALSPATQAGDATHTAAGSATGNADQTLPAATQAAVAGMDPDAAPAQTLSAIVQSADVAQAFAAACVQTLIGVRQAGSAGIAFDAGAAAVLAALTQDGHAIQSIAAAAAQALSAVEQLGAANMVPSADATQALAKIVQSVAAEQIGFETDLRIRDVTFRPATGLSSVRAAAVRTTTRWLGTLVTKRGSTL